MSEGEKEERDGDGLKKVKAKMEVLRLVAIAGPRRGRFLLTPMSAPTLSPAQPDVLGRKKVSG